MSHKKIKVWIETGSKVTLYEVPPTVMKAIGKLIGDYECKPKKPPTKK
jgi:hypothetical protein